MKKILIIGHGRHGKDTVCEILEEYYGLTFTSSSFYLAENIIYPVLKHEMGYKSAKECYDNRHKHRLLWKKIIKEYNHPDLARLTKEISSKYDIYCGLRDYDEFIESKKQEVFDVIVGVDAKERVSYIDPSFEIPLEEADLIIHNNGSYDDLKKQVDRFSEEYLK